MGQCMPPRQAGRPAGFITSLLPTARLPSLPLSYYDGDMKVLTVRIPDALVAEIEAESRGRRLSKSDIVRERLSRPGGPARGRIRRLRAIADLIGSVDGLPADLSTRTKAYLKTTGYGRKPAR